MSAPQQDPNVLDFTSDVNRKLTDDDRIGFTLDGEPYTLLRPKLGAMTSLTLSTTAMGHIDTTAPLNIDDIRQISSAVNTLLVNVAEPGQSKIRRRLEDPTDGLDITDLAPMVTKIVEALAVRPTIAQPGSS